MPLLKHSADCQFAKTKLETGHTDQPLAPLATCERCDFIRRERRNGARRERDDIRRSLGLKRVRGALGGVYWE